MEVSKNDLIKEGIQLLNDALCRFDAVEDCDTSSWVVKVVYHAIQLITELYKIDKE